MSAVFTTAVNDEFASRHPCKGVRTPVIPVREYTIVTPEQFDRLYHELPNADARLLTETAIETGIRWGELTELRVTDLDFPHSLINVRRAVTDIQVAFRVDGNRFAIKDYPKGRKPRRFKLAPSIAAKLETHVTDERLRPEDLLFRYRPPTWQDIPEVPDPDTLGRTAPNAKGRTHQHGTTTAYQLGGCKCEHCRRAYARYRALRRASGKDDPRSPRVLSTDGHIPRDWWRANIWLPALERADLGIHVRFHDLRHAHASWLLAGGANLEVVRDRLGHSSIATTQKYLHTLPEADETALEALSKIRNRGAEG